jgi:hypothetical protein
MGRPIADVDTIPAWLLHGLREDAEGSIDGIRWVTNGHIALPVSDGTWHVLPGPVGSMLAIIAEETATRTRLGSYIVEAHRDGGLPPFGDAGLFCGASSFAATWPERNVSAAIYYLAVVHHIFGNAVTWWALGPLDPILAKVGDEVVAVVMPVRRLGTIPLCGPVETEAQASRP